MKTQISNIDIQIDDLCKEFHVKIKEMKREALGDIKKRRTEI